MEVFIPINNRYLFVKKTKCEKIKKKIVKKLQKKMQQKIQKKIRKLIKDTMYKFKYKNESQKRLTETEDLRLAILLGPYGYYVSDDYIINDYYACNICKQIIDNNSIHGYPIGTGITSYILCFYCCYFLNQKDEYYNQQYCIHCLKYGPIEYLVNLNLINNEIVV